MDGFPVVRPMKTVGIIVGYSVSVSVSVSSSRKVGRSLLPEKKLEWYSIRHLTYAPIFFTKLCSTQTIN